MDRRHLMLALQSGLPIVEAPAETPTENNSANSSNQTSPIQRFKSVPLKVQHPMCCGILMGPGEGEHTLQCARCAKVQYEETPARSGRRTTKETRRAAIIEELTKYNQRYSTMYEREIPAQYLHRAADIFIEAKEHNGFRDAPEGSHRNSILAAILVYVCKGHTNFVESDIMNFLRAGGVRVKIQFSSGERILRDMYNKKLAGIDLNVDPTPQMMRGNLLFLELLATNGVPKYALPPGADIERAAMRILEISEELTIAPGVQPKTRTLGVIWFLLVRLHARGFCQELKLRDIKEKCNIGDATITSFQRALERQSERFQTALVEFKIEEDADRIEGDEGDEGDKGDK